MFKISGSIPFRVFTYVSPLIFFAITFGVFVGVSSLHPLIPALPTKLGPPWDELIGPYLLVMAGVILHLLTASIKQGQAEMQIIATQDFLTWIHLRWLGLALTYVEVVMVVIALFKARRTPGPGDALPAGQQAEWPLSVAGLIRAEVERQVWALDQAFKGGHHVGTPSSWRTPTRLA